MRSAALIRYDIATLEKSPVSYLAPVSVQDAFEANKARRLARLEKDLVVATRRELKRLAKYLTYKADIYGPTGRIYSCDAKWTVREDVLGKAYLFHGDKLIDPEQLCDGHGRTITLPD